MIRSRIPSQKFSTAASAAIRKKAIKFSGAPPTISAIRDDGTDVGSSSVFIREVGCTRRVFLLKPYMTQPEIEGLAYRIRTLTKNEALNSVLIATDDNDDVENGALPSSLVERDYPYIRDDYFLDEGYSPKPGYTYHVSGGYDPLALYESGDYKNPEAISNLLSSLSDLALAVKGDWSKTKIPVITVPHGAVHDAGFAFLMSSYVMATPESTFRITNPSKGLALDPVGLSYYLPRLGREFNQPAAEYKGCGMILGLMGYEADCSDMMETGLATNFMDSVSMVGSFESTLAELPPWNQQQILKKPVRLHGQPELLTDFNAQFRNIQVATTVHCFSAYRADGADMWDSNDMSEPEVDDPSLELDPVPWSEYRTSDLVDFAATFQNIFNSENTVVGMWERLKEIAGRKTNDKEEQEGIDVAADLVDRLERQSPLSVTAVHRLLTIGSNERESLKTCMDRERVVQAKLYSSPDYRNWAKWAFANKGKLLRPSDSFTGWKHKRLDDVTADEVLELLEV